MFEEAQIQNMPAFGISSAFTCLKGISSSLSFHRPTRLAKNNPTMKFLLVLALLLAAASCQDNTAPEVEGEMEGETVGEMYMCLPSSKLRSLRPNSCSQNARR